MPRRSPAEAANDPQSPATDEEADGSDQEVPEDEPVVRSRGRPFTGGRKQGRYAAGQQRGGHGAPGVPPRTSPRQRGTRPSVAPNRLAEEQAAGRREKKARKRKLDAALEEHVPEAAAIQDVRTLCREICEALQSRCCGADVLPIAPKQVLSSSSSILCFKCTQCDDSFTINGAKRTRLLVDIDEDEQPEDAEEADEAQATKRTKTNARPEDAARSVLGCLLSGNNYSQYVTWHTVQQLDVMHHSTFDRYLSLLMPKIQRLTDELIELGRYCVVVHGEGTICNLVVTNDWFWLTRGHYSNNGTGTICDWKSAAILSYRHYCRRGDSLSNVEAYAHSSKSMDANGFGEMLEEVVDWVEKDVDTLIEKHDVQLPGVPNFDGVVLDGDASTDHFVVKAREAVRAKAAEAADSSNYCKNLCVRPCTNHLAKNTGAKAFEIGHRLHRTCSCPIKKTVDQQPFKSGQREHRGVNTDSHPLVKAWQRGVGAALRGAKAWQKKAGYEDETLVDLARRGVEECFNHLSNVHDGDGFSSGEPLRCRLHAHDNAAPYTSRQYNDCADFQRELKAYLQSDVLDKLEQIIHPTLGALSQNASERVGDVALQYRAKHTELRATHYVCSTSLALCHTQAVVIEKFKRRLQRLGRTDARLEKFDTYERRLHELVGLPVSDAQTTAWRAALSTRAKRSEARQTIEYIRKRKQQRAKLKEVRESAKQDAGGTYKGDGSKTAVAHGVAGHCTCKGQCVRNCPCKTAGQRCTASCHGGRTGCKNAADGVGPAPMGPATADVAVARQHALPSPPPLDESFEGAVVWFRFEEAGWQQGVVDEELSPGEEEDDDGKPCNFLIYYESDHSEVGTCVDPAKYSTRANAPAGAWFVVPSAA
eukprot:scaffold38504_cov111-Phaeocystis_antarctica.AAC.5